MPLASDQVQFSLLYRKHEKEGLLAKAKELGVSVIAYSPLAQGLLTGEQPFGQPFHPSGFAFPHMGLRFNLRVLFAGSLKLMLPCNLRVPKRLSTLPFPKAC